MILNPARAPSGKGPGPDNDVVLRTLERTAEGSLELVAVYGATSFDLFHVGDALGEALGADERLPDHIAALAQESRSEFVEHGLFAGMRPTGAQVDYRTEERDGLRFLYVYYGGRGMLLAIDPDEPIPPLVRTAAGLLGSSL